MTVEMVTKVITARVTVTGAPKGEPAHLPGHSMEHTEIQMSRVVLGNPPEGMDKVADTVRIRGLLNDSQMHTAMYQLPYNDVPGWVSELTRAHVGGGPFPVLPEGIHTKLLERATVITLKVEGYPPVEFDGKKIDPEMVMVMKSLLPVPISDVVVRGRAMEGPLVRDWVKFTPDDDIPSWLRSILWDYEEG